MLVTAVGVDDEHTIEPVVGQTQCDICGVVDEVLSADSYASGEVQMVGTVTVDNTWHQKDLVWNLLASLPADCCSDVLVYSDWQVGSMLFNCRGWKDDYAVLLS